MGRRLMSGALVAALVGVILVAGTALPQDKPDGTITFSGGSVSVGIGYTWGGEERSPSRGRSIPSRLKDCRPAWSAARLSPPRGMCTA